MLGTSGRTTAGLSIRDANKGNYFSVVRNYCLLIISLFFTQSLIAATDKPMSPKSSDPMFQKPYIDQDEWRDSPVRHRYVHGGFEGTDTRFSFYLPPKDKYDGRFFQYITPVPDSETLSQGATGEEDKIGFSIASGAYFVETNGGGQGATAGPGRRADSTIGAYRANAAAAQYSRQVALEMYGGERPYGYAFGGSGGAYRTIGGMENTEGVWDGAVPFVLGSPMALPNIFTTRVYAMRVLGDKLGDVADAVDVGGSQDPYATLNEEQKAALKETTGLGFPIKAWYGYETLGLHAFAVIFPAVVGIDPSYFKDFWNKPGYEGYEPTPSLKAARIQFPTTIKKLIMPNDAEAMGLTVSRFAGEAKGLADNAWKATMKGSEGGMPVAIQLAGLPSKSTVGADLLITSGEAKGSKISMSRTQGDVVILGAENSSVVAKLKEGDQVKIDNSNFLAVQTYHRHQVPGKEYKVWDQFRDEKGEPLYPQRPFLLGPIFAKGASGTVQTGEFKGKMIALENLYDTEAFPWQGDWYLDRVKEHLGDKTDDHFRLWYSDRTNHGDFTDQKYPTQTVSYLGVLQQALRDLSAWVEEGVEPAPTSSYTVVDGQVIQPETAAERHGIQPVVKVQANGKERAEISAGESVSLTASVAVPPNTGTIVAAEWDFDGQGKYPLVMDLDKIEQKGDQLTLEITHQFDKPGTYFPTLRVASQREGDAETAFARVQNLGRVRVVVEK
ncbi:PKD domain-containing protein [Pseudomaricurvus sp.]|uniref:PKD domain-containing protein n=1 Tax=Pseudomaricurvus sp. TaxID=2004510 RepID=UPI003F6C7C30